jgi:hypothetical protein
VLRQLELLSVDVTKAPVDGALGKEPLFELA